MGNGFWVQKMKYGFGFWGNIDFVSNRCGAFVFTNHKLPLAKKSL